eukprot:3933079-Rhodomonas_salina.2
MESTRPPPAPMLLCSSAHAAVVASALRRSQIETVERIAGGSATDLRGSRLGLRGAQDAIELGEQLCCLLVPRTRGQSTALRGKRAYLRAQHMRLSLWTQHTALLHVRRIARRRAGLLPSSPTTRKQLQERLPGRSRQRIGGS